MPLIKCPQCGNELQEDSKFCNKCGSRLQTEDIQTTEQPKEEPQIESKNNNNNLKSAKLKSILKNKKIFIPTLIVCCLVVITCIIYSIIKPPSAKAVFEKIKDYDVTDAISYLDKVYPDKGNTFGLFKEKNKKNKKIVLLMIIENIDNKFKKETGRSIEDYNAVKITKVEIKHKSYSSDYVDINVTVNNGSKTPINYIKINLYYKDENSNIVKSDWTNDNSVILPGASQVITNMTKSAGWNSVHAEIAEIR